MIAAAIRAEVILHRGLGMSHRQIVEQFVATVLGSPEHHVEIHHIVHDGIVSQLRVFTSLSQLNIVPTTGLKNVASESAEARITSLYS